MFSILIPTFNNLEYLKICIDSIKKNSNYEHQIIVHVNEGSDKTIDYVQQNNLDVEVRFDVISILKKNNALEIQHIENAFYHF